MKSNRGAASILAIIAVFVLGGLSAVFGMFAEPTAPAGPAEVGEVLHIGTIQQIKDYGQTYKLVIFSDGADYFVDSPCNAPAGGVTKIIKRADGYHCE